MSGEMQLSGETQLSRETQLVPPPGQAAMPAKDAAAMIRLNGSDRDRSDRPAVLFADRRWSHSDFLAESVVWANLFLARRREGRPFHVGLLLDNTPDYLFAMGGAALSGATIVGLNHTRRGEALLRDMSHTDIGLIVTEPRHQALLEPVIGGLAIDDGHLLVSGRFADPDDPPLRMGEPLGPALEAAGGEDPLIDPGADSYWALIFTSGTSEAPKAVRCSQRRILVTGVRMAMSLEITSVDVGYVSMPLFHSNAIMVGWAPALVQGACVGLARKFSASGWLPDVRRYRATYFNYTGKPLSYVLATPEKADDADNTVRRAFGNEGSPKVVAEFSRRFGVDVIDAFGATEGGIAASRTEDQPVGSVGLAGAGVRIVGPNGEQLARARFDQLGKLVNAEECVGEMVNVEGYGPFEGYYNNEEANARATRKGWYWSGDLGYMDQNGYLFFAGRTSDWIRVDGENFPAGPIEATLSRHPDVMLAAVYGVPDQHAGDQVMAALVSVPGTDLDTVAFGEWIDAQPDLSPKWRPRYLRISFSIPTTATNKVVKRALVHDKQRRDRVGADALYVRERGEDRYRPFTAKDEATLHEALVEAGRERFWDL